MMTPIHSNWLTMRVVLACGALALVVVACGGRDGDAATQTPRVAPTALSAQFAMPTSMITPRAAVTATVAVITATVAAGTPEPDAATPGSGLPTETPTVELSRGERVYLNQNCAECHGEDAQGLPDKGARLAGTTLSYAEFENALRTGGMGELGKEHIFGPNRISPGGVVALHAWLQSLPAE